MITIFVAGGTGMLGSILSKYLKTLDCQVVVHGFKNSADVKVDLTDSAAVIKLLDIVKPDFIVNLVCLSDVERNEKEQDLAYRLNVRPVENIAAWIQLREANTKLIQVSTDHVYDAPGNNSENRVVFRNVYAATKYCAERVALGVEGAVLRTNFFGKAQIGHRQSFSDWLELQIKSKTPVNLFRDVYFSPLSTGTLVKMIAHVINKFNPGVYNLGSRDGMSKAEFANMLAKLIGGSQLCSTEISVEDLGFSAVRPKGMLMDVSKFEESFNVSLPTLESEIKAHLEGIKD